MRTIERSTAFKKDYKRELRGQRGPDLEEKLIQYVTKLVNDEALPSKASDHALSGAWAGYRDCMSHALGSVLTERLMGGAPSVPKRQLALVKGVLATVPRSRYPSLAAVSTAFDRWSFDRMFEVGLHSLIEGLAEAAPRRTHAARSRRRPSRRLGS